MTGGYWFGVDQVTAAYASDGTTILGYLQPGARYFARDDNGQWITVDLPDGVEAYVGSTQVRAESPPVTATAAPPPGPPPGAPPEGSPWDDPTAVQPAPTAAGWGAAGAAAPQAAYPASATSPASATPWPVYLPAFLLAGAAVLEIVALLQSNDWDGGYTWDALFDFGFGMLQVLLAVAYTAAAAVALSGRPKLASAAAVGIGAVAVGDVLGLFDWLVDIGIGDSFDTGLVASFVASSAVVAAGVLGALTLLRDSDFGLRWTPVDPLVAVGVGAGLLNAVALWGWDTVEFAGPSALSDLGRLLSTLALLGLPVAAAAARPRAVGAVAVAFGFSLVAVNLAANYWTWQRVPELDWQTYWTVQVLAVLVGWAYAAMLFFIAKPEPVDGPPPGTQPGWS